MAEFRVGDRNVEETKRNGVTRYAIDDFRIYQIKVESVMGYLTNVYLVLNGEISLVDVGSHVEKARSNLKKGFEVITRDFHEDISLGDVDNVILTHSHADHFGMLVHAELKGKKLLVHEADSGMITDYPGSYDRSLINIATLAREAGCDYRGDEEGLWTPEELTVCISDYDLVKVKDGQEFLAGYRACHTPGHSPGHMCLTLGPVVFSGDHILAVITPQFPKTYGPGNGLQHYLDSARKVGMIGDTLGLAGHGKPIYSVKDRVQEIQDVHQRFLDELVTMGREEMTLYELAKDYHQLHSQVSRAHSLDHLPISRRIRALEDIKAHVEYLVDTGRMVVSGRDGHILRYRSS